MQRSLSNRLLQNQQGEEWMKKGNPSLEKTGAERKEKRRVSLVQPYKERQHPKTNKDDDETTCQP